MNVRTLWFCTANCRGRLAGDPSGAAALAPPLGELLSEREAEGVRYEILDKLRYTDDTPSATR